MSVRVIFGMLVALTTTVTAVGPGSALIALEDPGETLRADHPVFRAALGRLWQGSRSWRLAMGEVSTTGRRVVVLTPSQVVVQDDETMREFDADVLAEAAPLADGAGRVSTVLVVVNLPLIERLHQRRGSLPAEIDADLDRVLAHEIYGHAVPILLAGHLSGRCADPAPGQAAGDACAVQRENIVRHEMRLGRRTDAGVNGLLLAFRGRH